MWNLPKELKVYHTAFYGQCKNGHSWCIGCHGHICPYCGNPVDFGTDDILARIKAQNEGTDATKK